MATEEDKKKGLGCLSLMVLVGVWWVWPSPEKRPQPAAPMMPVVVPTSSPAPAPKPIEQTQSTPQPQDAGQKPIAVDNRKLFDDFNTNEIAATKKYVNKILEVTSILDRVEMDAEGDPVLYLATRNQFMWTSASLLAEPAASDERIEQLTRGDKVVLTCICLGRSRGVPILGACVLQKAFRRE